LFFFKYFIDESVLNIDSSRETALQISRQFFVGRRILKGISLEKFDEFLGLGFKMAGGKCLRVLLRLSGKYDPIHHQSSVSDACSTPSSRACWTDSTIPGIEFRYNVSWIELQSDSDSNTAFPRFPVIWIGLWEIFASSMRRYSWLLALVAEIVVIPNTYVKRYGSSSYALAEIYF
jgi:hypothetical protein